MSQKLFKHFGRTFVVRNSSSGGFNVFLKLNGLGSGQVTWIASAQSSSASDLRAAISQGKRDGQW